LDDIIGKKNHNLTLFLLSYISIDENYLLRDVSSTVYEDIIFNLFLIS